MTPDFISEAIATLLDEGFTDDEIQRIVDAGMLEETYLEIVLS